MKPSSNFTARPTQKLNPMPNKCEGCPRNCCLDFKITTELTEPSSLWQELAHFTFIKKTGTALVYDPSGHERVVGIYNCDRFDSATGECLDYEARQRPSFCQTTGIKVSPHAKCLLKSKKHESKGT